MLTIQFGQCGNQLGSELFEKITSDIESGNSGLSFRANFDYIEASCEKWFSGITKDGKKIARAILIDTEKKAVGKICGKKSSHNSWRYSSKNTIYQTHGEGSANNWAYGYCVKSKELENRITEAVRSEVEKSDRLDGFLGLLGCAGGTGSGVGSKTLELLREEFTTKTILGSLVLPFASGEVGPQNYNSLLTLAKFTDTADVVILMENDQLFRICTSIGSRRGEEARFLQDMNVVACEKLVSVLQPVGEVRNEANHFATKMAPHPGYKMATIKCTAPLQLSSKCGEQRQAVNLREYETGSLKWQVHVGQLKHTLRIAGGASNYELRSDFGGNSRVGSSTRGNNAESSHLGYRRSIANILITRGYSGRNNNNRNDARGDNDDSINTEQLTENSLYPRWIPRDHRFTHFHQKRRLLEREKFATLVTNNSQIRESIDGIVNKAWNCYTHAAFLHRYKQHGLEDDDFLRAFAKVENVVKLYGELDGQ